MSDGAISQDEIDALLAGVDMGGLGSSGSMSSSSPSVNIDTAALADFLSDTAGTLKSSLDTMTGSVFEVGKPTVEAVDRDGVLRKVPEMVVSVMNDFTTGLSGDHVFILAPEFATKLTALINKEENPDLDDMALSVVSEVVSQHTGSENTKLSQTGKLNGLASKPAEAQHVPKAMVRFQSSKFALATYPVSVDGGAFSLWEIFAADVANGIVKALGGGQDAASTGGLSAEEMQSMVGGAMGGGMNMGGMNMGMGANPMGGMNMGGMNMGMGANPMGGMNMSGMNMGMGANPMGGMHMGGMNMGMGVSPMGGMPQNIPNVQPLSFPNLQTGMGSTEQQNINLIMDVYMEVTVELGRTKKLIKDILGMGEGTIIELDKLAGEPVDILVNHKQIARGEVVVIDENFGVRVTEILSTAEREAAMH
ncbi:MAG: flagellar motor switch protein FliN [Treponemataceae bacterium]|nr:flagellar motor switch protein FliN [Treponemataceae bacterium]